MDSFSRICRDIQSVRIQGATNIAKAALKAYSLNHTKAALEKLRSLRPTEPALYHALEVAHKYSVEQAMAHFENAQQFINYYVAKIIGKGAVIMTHCHSNTLVQALIAAHKSGKDFSVLNLETRPLFQGRITATQLAKAGIKVHMAVDSAMDVWVRKADMVLVGADAVTNKGVINKIGSGALAELAHNHTKEVYVVTDSWKLWLYPLPLEKRPPQEVWRTDAKKITIENPAFELIPAKYVHKIISELGVLSHKEFLKAAKKSLTF